MLGKELLTYIILWFIALRVEISYNQVFNVQSWCASARRHIHHNIIQSAISVSKRISELSHSRTLELQCKG